MYKYSGNNLFFQSIGVITLLILLGGCIVYGPSNVISFSFNKLMTLFS